MRWLRRVLAWFDLTDLGRPHATPLASYNEASWRKLKMSSAQPLEQHARTGLSNQLSGFNAEIQDLFATVTFAVKWATEAFVSGDQSEIARLTEGTQLSRSIVSGIERQLDLTFAREAPVAGDLRLMITALRVVPALDRCLDLARHIAERAGIAHQLPPEVVASFAEMGSVTAAMWEKASVAWQNRDVQAAATLDADDDELDVLCGELIERLGELQSSTQTAMEARLIVRFYERLGDHAVHISERLIYLATGQQPAET